MQYFAVVKRGQSVGEAFAQALSSNTTTPAAVYVVGLSDEDALAIALIDGIIEGDDLDASTALKFAYTEVIGTEDHTVKLGSLLSAARKRIAEIVAHDSTRGSIIR